MVDLLDVEQHEDASDNDDIESNPGFLARPTDDGLSSSGG
jgi:hypothetical protein